VSATGTINELLIRWQELRQSGVTPSVRDLCADYPSLAEELARRIAAFESMEDMLGLGARTTPPTPGRQTVPPPHLAEKFLPLGYELLEVIDQGGMGIVYKAIQTGLRRTVALKMIAGLRIGPKQLARFRVEAEAVARLQHPYIVQIHEVGEVDGHSFFAMEYVEGGTLAHRLATGPLSPNTAAELLEILARAMQHAHERGIIHRDLKPANILLAGVRRGSLREAEGIQGTGNRKQEAGSSLSPEPLPPRGANLPCPLSSLVPKVSDFGLAKQLDAEHDHTATSEVIGTPAYMAPEQAQGGTTAIGPACDIYALGAILYETLTGRPPFKAVSMLKTLQQVIADEPVAPCRIHPGIPRDLEAICLKCLEKNPTHRYASAEALADDLRRFRDGTPVTARRLSVVSRTLKWARRRRVWIAAVLLVSLVGAGIPVLGYVDSENRRRRVAELASAEIEQRQARAIELAPQAREILHRHCYDCHGGDQTKAVKKFHVFHRDSLLDANRQYVVPHEPDQSRLIKRIKDGSMPPPDKEADLPRVSELELSILNDWIAGGAPPFPPEDPNAPTPPVIPYSELGAKVKAIFLRHCFECHREGTPTEQHSGIKILNHDLLIKTRKVVVPEQPDESVLYQLITSNNEHQVMPPLDPPDRARLTPDEIGTVRRWIEAGAPPFPRTRPKEK
jgi:serine/threonine protein kinase